MTMIRKILLLTLLFFIEVVYAQIEVLDRYPYGQDFYAGGLNQLNKEMVKIFRDQKLQPCEKSEEKYDVQIIVYDNSKISYVKDFDTLEIQKNKCAFDLSRKIFPHLKRWMPAKENGKFIAAITKIRINPFYLYYSKEDPSKNEEKGPAFKKGLEAYQYEVRSIFEKYIKNNRDQKSSLTFVVNENGDMEDIKINGDFPESDKSDVIKSLSRMKGKWNPGTFNNIPVRTRMRQSVIQEFDMRLELEEREKSLYQNMYNRYR